MPTICIGIPMHHAVTGKTLKSVHEMDQVPGYMLSVYYADGALVYAVRGMIADHVLKTPDIEYLLFCDADMVPPKHGMTSLFSRDADIVSGLCCRREVPYRPVVMRAWEEASGGPVEDPSFLPLTGAHPIWGAGLAFTLIKRHVLEAVRKEFGSHLFFHEKLKNGDPMGEDVTFYWKANKLGFKTILDADVHVGHLSEYPIYPTDSARLFNYSSGEMVERWTRDARIRELEEKVKELEAKGNGIPNFALAGMP